MNMNEKCLKKQTKENKSRKAFHRFGSRTGKWLRKIECLGRVSTSNKKTNMVDSSLRALGSFCIPILAVSSLLSAIARLLNAASIACKAQSHTLWVSQFAKASPKFCLETFLPTIHQLLHSTPKPKLWRLDYESNRCNIKWFVDEAVAPLWNCQSNRNVKLFRKRLGKRSKSC